MGLRVGGSPSGGYYGKAKRTVKSHVQYQGDFRWAGTYRLAYKPQDRSHFDRISRQTLFAGLADLDCERH